MTKWQPIETLPDAYEDVPVLIYDPVEWGVCEARASRNGNYCDPVYYEWSYSGATHWMPLPDPPIEQTDNPARTDTEKTQTNPLK